MKITSAECDFRDTVSMHDGMFAFQSTGSGLDDALAAWDALCSLEQALRQARARRKIRHPAERFDHG